MYCHHCHDDWWHHFHYCMGHFVTDFCQLNRFLVYIWCTWTTSTRYWQEPWRTAARQQLHPCVFIRWIFCCNILHNTQLQSRNNLLRAHPIFNGYPSWYSSILTTEYWFNMLKASGWIRVTIECWLRETAAPLLCSCSLICIAAAETMSMHYPLSANTLAMLIRLDTNHCGQCSRRNSPSHFFL